MDMRDKSTYEVYEKYKSGTPINQLADEYCISINSVRAKINSAKFDEDCWKRMNDFQKRFPLNIARTLKRNGINSEDDIYEAINTARNLRLIGKKTASQIGKVLGLNLTVKLTNGKYNAIAYADEPKVKTLYGNFCGTIDGSLISGIIEGDFLPLER